jgi:hypothetical protein
MWLTMWHFLSILVIICIQNETRSPSLLISLLFLSLFAFRGLWNPATKWRLKPSFYPGQQKQLKQKI